MDFPTREDSMISIQMPSDYSTRETSREFEWSISTPSSDIREPLFEKKKGSAPPPPPMDMNNISGLEKLSDIEGVHIEKNYFFDNVPCFPCWCRECPTGVEQYRYKISELGASGKEESGETIFTGTENIPEFDNIWCTKGHRAFDIDVEHQEFNWRVPNASAFLKLERKEKCSFLCFWRPEMIVTLAEGGQNERLGRIVNPIQCGVDFRMKVYNAEESLRYIIKAGCFSCGVVCPNSCGVTKTVMEVCNPFGTVMAKLIVLEGKKVPEGVRHSFSMNFPEDANGYDKALLVAAIMMIGKTFFEANDLMTNFCEALPENIDKCQEK